MEKSENQQKHKVIDYGPYLDYPTKPIGGGNPYYCCSSCGISDPQINGTLSRHGQGCKWVVLKRLELLSIQ